MKNWKYLLIATMVCGLQPTLQAQQSLLAKYDFAQGGYTLLVIDNRPDYADYDEGFNNGFEAPPEPDAPVYYDDVQSMRAIQSKLTFLPGDIVAHDYCYSDKTLQVCKGGIELERLGFSAKCAAVLVDTADYFYLGSFDFEGAKPAKLRLDEFPDVKRARLALDSIRRSPDLIWLEEPEWVQFEGVFMFNVGAGQRSVQQCQDSVTADIAQRFPGEPLAVVALTDDFQDEFFTGEVVPEFTVVVTCNASLCHKFGQGQAAAPEWKAHPLVLASYWR